MMIHYKCPKCGKSEIEEIMRDVTVASEVGPSAEIADNGQIALVYFDQTNEDAGHRLSKPVREIY